MRLTPLPHTTVPTGAQLGCVVADVWQRIARGLDGRWPPWGLPALATVSEEGPRVRVLALRSADAQRRTLVFHTDARSDKVREIVRHPRVSVMFWDPADGIEARFTGVAEVHRNDAIAHTAWQNVSPLRRFASRIVEPPGSPLAQSCRFDELATQADAHAGSENFAVLEVAVDHLDWLWVGAEDMRRATFSWDGGTWTGHWTNP